MDNLTSFQSDPAIRKMPQGVILIIDDDPVIHEVLTRIFSLFLKMGTVTATNGHEGLQIFQQQSVALVFLDMNMPGMSGEQTYENLRQLAPHVRVIVSSSLSLTEIKSRFGERELPTFLQKPYDIDTLLNVVQAEFTFVRSFEDDVSESANLPSNGESAAIDKYPDK